MKKLMSVLSVIIASSMLFSSLCSASDSLKIVQASINEKNMDLFLSESFESDSLQVKVANTKASITDCGTVAEKNVNVRTTVLVDISASIPVKARENITELINKEIEDVGENEELRLAVFDSELKILQDFTSDRYDLDKAIKNIEFTGQRSTVFDAIYNTIPEIKTVDDSPCFYRTVVITDGVDSAVQGITKEELFMRLQAETYPIDVVCVSKKKEETQDKDLSALTRISNGRYFDICPETDMNSLFSAMKPDSYYWIRATVDSSLLDGSTRQVDVTDSNGSVSFDLKMSVVDKAPVATIPAPIATEITTQSVEVEPQEKEGGDLNLVLIAAVMVVILIIVLIIVLVGARKSSPTSAQNTARTAPVPDNSETIIDTEMYNENEDDALFSVKISNTASLSESWVFDVASGIVIGRGDNCQLKLADKTASREQCRIFIKNSSLYLINLSNSNQTKLNGTAISSEMPLNAADVIRFGRVSLRIEYIQKIGQDVSPAPNEGRKKKSSGGTESIF